jgi:hypothetical protein
VEDKKSPQPDLVKIYNAQQMLEAEMIKAILEDEGIPAVVKDARLTLMIGWPLWFRGFDVLVPSDQAEKARTLLENERGPDWVCPKCGEKIDGVFDACWKCGVKRE